jgi:hypothetical protein
MTNEDCTECGHPKERVRGEFVQPHHLGCAKKLGASTPESKASPWPPAPKCAREGCENEVPPSRGPKPAKYCTDHRTNRSKK